MDQYKSWSYIESGFYKYLDVNVYKKPNKRVRRDTFMLKKISIFKMNMWILWQKFWVKIVSQDVKLQ